MTSAEQEGASILPGGNGQGLPPCKRPVQGLVTIFRTCVENPLIPLVIFGSIVLVCGYFGFSDYYLKIPDSQEGSSDFLYRTLQLFVLNSVELSRPPLTLEIARFCAAVFVALSFFFVLFKLFWEQVQSFLLWLSRRKKAVICGLGYLGPCYAQMFVEKGYRTVVIEKDPSASSLGLPGHGVVFIRGDATDPAVLKRVHLRKTDIMMIVTGDDLTNIRIAISAREMIHGKRLPTATHTPSGPAIIIHILDRWLDNALRLRFVPLYRNPQFFHFNMYTRAANDLVPKIWKEIVPEKEKKADPGKIHLLLIGVGTMGEEIGKQFVRYWHDRIEDQPDSASSLTFSLIDYKDAKDKAQRLNRWIGERKCPEGKVRIHEYNYRVPSADFLAGTYLNQDAEGNAVPPVSAVIICLANQTLAMTTALEIVPVIKAVTQQPAGPAAPIPPVYVRFIRDDEITRFIRLLGEQEEFSAFRPYTVAENGKFWNDNLEQWFPDRPCRIQAICPLPCGKKMQMNSIPDKKNPFE